MRKPSDLSPEEVHSAVEAFKDGQSSRWLGGQLQVPHSSLRDMFARMGVTSGNRGGGVVVREGKLILAGVDHQIPFQDDLVLALFEQYARDIQPDVIVLPGDVLDFWMLSTKFKRRGADPQELVAEIARGELHIRRLHEAAPNAKIVWIAGNHEERLYNYVIELAPALEPFTQGAGGLTLPHLLGLKDEKWFEYIGPYGEVYEYDSFLFKHGESTTQYAAKKELETEGSSGLSGHTHRSQSYFRTDRKGSHGWWSLPAMCNITGAMKPPGYRKGASSVTNWQQGFGVVRFGPKKEEGTLFNVYPIIVSNGEFVSPEGVLYTRRSVL
tara:strand:- start:153 stop:1130 length:978 start_codon:yes stop_codon:yes gene_type:complete